MLFSTRFHPENKQQFNKIQQTDILKTGINTYCTRNVLSRSRQFGSSAEESFGHFGTGAELSGHFGTSLIVLKCLGSEVS